MLATSPKRTSSGLSKQFMLVCFVTSSAKASCPMMALLPLRKTKLRKAWLPLFQAASIRGQALQASETDVTVEKVFQLVPSNQRFRPPTLCADFNGFSLHAATRIPVHDRATLERLCRYINRPPFSGQSLTLDHTGKILFQHPILGATARRNSALTRSLSSHA
jgi:hypothetical protein